MQRGLLCCVLAIFVCQVEMRRSSGGSKKGSHGDSNDDVEREDTYGKVANTLDNLGRSLEYLLIGGLHSPIAPGILKFIPQISALLSGTGFAMKIFRIYAGKEESAMMRKLKTSFLHVNRRLDDITSDLKNNRNLIKLETKRAAYIEAENKILSADDNVRKYITDLKKLKCNGTSDCVVKKQLIAQRYLPRFNVKKEIYSILHGATVGQVFGDSLVTLTKESSKCDIMKIKLTASIIAGLAVKGQRAVMLYESITDPAFDVISFEANFQQSYYLLKIRRKMRQRNVMTK